MMYERDTTITQDSRNIVGTFNRSKIFAHTGTGRIQNSTKP